MLKINPKYFRLIFEAHLSHLTAGNYDIKNVNSIDNQILKLQLLLIKYFGYKQTVSQTYNLIRILLIEHSPNWWENNERVFNRAACGPPWSRLPFLE